MLNCIYCNEPVIDSCVDRGGFPIHPFCNQQLNEEIVAAANKELDDPQWQLDYNESHERWNHPPNS